MTPFVTQDMQLTDNEILGIRARVAALEIEHSDLDAAISHLSETGFPDQLTLLRLKKRKLSIKDEMTRLSMMLVPDIPA